jgi:hypothetical protein
MRGGSGGPIDPTYEAILKANQGPPSGVAVGNLEEDLSEQLPWPEGSESKKQSFVKYQNDYKQAQNDFRVCMPWLHAYVCTCMHVCVCVCLYLLCVIKHQA